MQVFLTAVHDGSTERACHSCPCRRMFEPILIIIGVCEPLRRASLAQQSMVDLPSRAQRMLVAARRFYQIWAALSIPSHPRIEDKAVRSVEVNRALKSFAKRKELLLGLLAKLRTTLINRTD